jgi:K+ transporter
MRALCFFLAVLFMVLAFYETGGTHPLIWILVFGTMALLSVLAMFSIYLRAPAIAIVALALGYFVVHYSDLSAALTKPPEKSWWGLLVIRYAVYASLCFGAGTFFLVAATIKNRNFKRLQT